MSWHKRYDRDGGGESKPSTWVVINHSTIANVQAFISTYGTKDGRQSTISIVQFQRDLSEGGLYTEIDRASRISPLDAISKAKDMLARVGQKNELEDIL